MYFYLGFLSDKGFSPLLWTMAEVKKQKAANPAMKFRRMSRSFYHSVGTWDFPTFWVQAENVPL